MRDRRLRLAAEVVLRGVRSQRDLDQGLQGREDCVDVDAALLQGDALLLEELQDVLREAVCNGII